MAFLRVHQWRLANQSRSTPRSDDALRLLMTGPGGTGKTHSVMALKDLMEVYGSGHRLRLLAPTGSAATLIEGTTCHSGLSLRVRPKSEQRRVGYDMLSQQYAVQISVKNKVKMRTEWKNVDIVLIDEVSLLSLQVVAEINSAFQFAKEEPGLWFGGVIVIFSGDFFQYPPIGGAPLYSTITSANNQSESELKKRLGRLAYLSFTECVEFTEQHRMKADPEYGDAVGRLRLRECVDSDVCLFNQRVIKLDGNVDGVDMDDGSNGEAVSIVGVNYMGEHLNLYKAQTLCARPSGAALIMCAA